MKLVYSSFILPFVAASTYESFCEQNTLTVKVPYSNEKTAQLLNFSAGSCTGSGASSLVHDYSYNATSQQAVFSVQIDECQLDENASAEDDGAGGERQAFTAIANITLGVNSNGQDLVFYNALVGAQCGETSDYTVTFTYASNIDIDGDVDCEIDENGNCVVPAYNLYHFGFTEYTDNTYITPVTEETRQTVANEPIFLKLASNDLPSYKKYAIKRCYVHLGEDGDSYEIFNPENAVCENDFIGLDWSYDVVYQNGGLSTEVKIQHQLFLLGQTEQNNDQVYSLSCDIKVCDRDDGSSECNQWVDCLDLAEREEYICDAEMEASCEDGHSCAIDGTGSAGECV